MAAQAVFVICDQPTENRIKDYKRACVAGRLSCHRFWANQFRIFLLKVGGRVREPTHRVRLYLASSHPSQPLWHLLATAIGRHE